MKSLNEKLKRFQSQLLDVSENVYHYFRPINPVLPFVVWSESGENSSFSSDNVKAEQAIDIAVDLYTKTEFDPLIDSLQELFNAVSGSWTLDAVSYEDDSELIHYSWSVEVG